MILKKNNKILLFIITLLWLFSFARLSTNPDYWIIDILSHFTLQYALIAFIILLTGFWMRAVPVAVLAGMLLVFNLSVFVSPGKAVHASVPDARIFKLYSANLRISNDELSGLNKELNKIDPEMVLLLEVTPKHLEQIQLLIQKYPYRIENSFLGKREIGFVFLSKFPILSSNVTRLSSVCNFILEAKMEIDHVQVMFYGVHAKRPDIDGFTERRDQFLSMAADLKEQKLPVIVAGDFNTTPFSPIFREVIKRSGLKNAGEGFGWQPSWPTFFPPLWIPIDHVLVTPDIQVLKRSTGSYIGSDHYPVIAELFLG